jgi:hypothetical protein
MQNKINLWDWVSYSSEFISTLNDPEELEGRIGQVVRVHSFGDMPIATIQWEDDDNLGFVGTDNLVLCARGGDR